MKNFKWSVTSFDDRPIYVVLFVSRNKDNSHIKNFVERRESFITHNTDKDEKLITKFNEFVNRGQKGEVSRMYISINERNGKAIYKELLLFLIENPDFNLCSLEPKLAGIAAKKECALTKKWMFDFDSEDISKLVAFTSDIKEIVDEYSFEIIAHKTPHGYAVVVDHGFDTRELLKKWPDVGLKRDDLLCAKWATKD